MRAFEVVVVGGGITGLAMAIDLARGGVDVALLVQGTLPGSATTASSGRTAALLQPAIDLLRRLGVFDPLALGAEPIYRLRIVSGAAVGAPRGGRLDFDSAELGLEAFGWNVPNDHLAASLGTAAKRAGGPAIFEGAGLELVEAEADRLVLHAGAARLEARLVVGADGRDSAVRRSAGIKAIIRDHGQTAIVCRFAHARSHRNTSIELHRSGGPFTTVPLPGRHSSLVWVDHTEASAARMALDDDVFQTALAEHAEPWLGAIGELSRRHAHPIRGLLARRLTAPRRVLVGEAAHVLSPLGAQGLNLSLCDVATLGAQVREHAGDPGDPALLDTYAAARTKDVGLRFWGIDTLNRLVMRDTAAFRLASSLAFGVLDRLPPARRALMQGLMVGV